MNDCNSVLPGEKPWSCNAIARLHDMFHAFHAHLDFLISSLVNRIP